MSVHAPRPARRHRPAPVRRCRGPRRHVPGGRVRTDGEPYRLSQPSGAAGGAGVTTLDREEPMELSTTSTLDAVRAVVVDTLGIDDRADALEAGTALFGSLPELDSLGVAELVVALEQRFDLEFDGDDVSADTFETLGSLAAVVEDKLR